MSRSVTDERPPPPPPPYFPSLSLPSLDIYRVATLFTAVLRSFRDSCVPDAADVITKIESRVTGYGNREELRLEDGDRLRSYYTREGL